MMQFTREQLIARIDTQKETARQHPECSIALMDLRLAEIALASMEAEPVLNVQFKNGWPVDGTAGIISGSPGIADGYHDFYTAPPAPVSVPEQWNKSLQEMVDAMRQYEMDIDEDAPHKHRAMMRRAEELLANRTAMLQVADENSSVIPDELIRRIAFNLVYLAADEKLRSDEDSLFTLVRSGMGEVRKILAETTRK